MLKLPRGFYSSIPAERVAALKRTKPEMRDEILKMIPQWPVKSPGTLNAWLVFLGPSPGNSPGPIDWTYDPRPSINSAHPGVAEYQDSNGYWEGLRRFSRRIFPEHKPDDAYAATMLRNLDTQHSAVAPTGPHMRPAAEAVLNILGVAIRPRLVIAMGGVRNFTDRVFRSSPLTRDHNSGVLFTAAQRLPRKWFSLVGTWPSGEKFLYLSPSGIHPSFFHVSIDDTLNFLDEQSQEARNLQ